MVESLQTMTHSRPATRPMPVMSPGAMNGVVVDAVRRERRQFEKRRAGIEQRHHALARQELAAREMALAGARRPAFGGLGACLFKLLDQSAHRCLIGAKLIAEPVSMLDVMTATISLTSKVNRSSETLCSRMRAQTSRACGNHK